MDSTWRYLYEEWARDLGAADPGGVATQLFQEWSWEAATPKSAPRFVARLRELARESQ